MKFTLMLYLALVVLAIPQLVFAEHSASCTAGFTAPAGTPVDALFIEKSPGCIFLKSGLYTRRDITKGDIITPDFFTNVRLIAGLGRLPEAYRATTIKLQKPNLLFDSIPKPGFRVDLYYLDQEKEVPLQKCAKLLSIEEQSDGQWITTMIVRREIAQDWKRIYDPKSVLRLRPAEETCLTWPSEPLEESTKKESGLKNWSCEEKNGNTSCRSY